ncbi:hypothetical protein BDN72DRAFT_579912 [Pluteus cervinus]|uniref:Uncharacterized protein n=1 Tax=Pluteus cervinus TaxID=181527 RepID=A0ACD3AVX0_9AGAR|nr:hypothetical protein BDN72DRAFT_579912 [Pluteus cervinus]
MTTRSLLQDTVHLYSTGPESSEHSGNGCFESTTEPFFQNAEDQFHFPLSSKCHLHLPNTPVPALSFDPCGREICLIHETYLAATQRGLATFMRLHAWTRCTPNLLVTASGPCIFVVSYLIRWP